MRCSALMVLLASCGLFSACAELTVKVRVLDPRVVEAEEERVLAVASLPRVLALDEDYVRAHVESRNAAHHELIEGIASRYRAEAAKASGASKTSLESIADGLQSSFAVSVSPLYKQAGDAWLGAVRNVQSLCPPTGSAPALSHSCLPASPALMLALKVEFAWSQRADELLLRSASQYGLSTYDDLTPEDKAAVVAAARRVEGRASVSLMSGRESVLGSRFLHAIAQAPDAAWGGDYNTVKVNARNGNVDAAVKLDPESGDFTLKGMSFDVRDVARVASRVGTQSVLLAAQIAGVSTPLEQPASGNSGAALANSSSDLAKALARSEAARADSADAVAAMRQLAESLRDRYREIGNDTTANKRTMALARAAFDAQKPRIAPRVTPAAAIAPQ